MIYGGHFDIPSKNDKIKELENISLQPDFWNDRAFANKIINEMNSLKEIVHMVDDLSANINSNIELCDLLLVDNDDDT